MKAKVDRILVGVAAVLICVGGSLAADLHPIVGSKTDIFSVRSLTENGLKQMKQRN